MAFDSDVPATANQIAADLVAMNANWEFLISGDGTKGRVLRLITLTIDNGTTGVGLKCTIASVWNGDTQAETDDIAKDGTTGNFTLNAGGTVLTIEAATLTGNAIAALAANIYQNLSTTALDVHVTVTANDLVITGYGAGDGVAKDLTTLVDTGKVLINILYLTSA